MRMKEW